MAIKEVNKVWGRELIVANSEKYAGKILVLDRGAVSSLHRHLEKDETMLCLEGSILLIVSERAYWLTPFSQSVNIKPGTWHMFVGISENNKIAEFSTEHKEEDVERLTTSKAGGD